MTALTTSIELSETEAKRRDELSGRLFGAFNGVLDLASVYLGDKLSLYRALSDGGPATSAQLARRAGINERYAREWLEQQATTGLLTVDSTTADPDVRVYTLPRGHAVALLDRDSIASATPMALFLEPVGRLLPRLVEAYRTGEGIAWSEYGEDCWRGQGDFNRPFFRGQLATELAKIPDLHAKLSAGGRVADVACGVGWSAIAIAKAYPKVKVEGYDLDAAAIAQANTYAKAEGVADRLRFAVRDAAHLDGGYDLVTIFEALHDMSAPVEVLRAVRSKLAPGGSLLVADENMTDTFSAPGSDVERIMYGASIVICLPNGLADRPSAATGTVMRPATMRRYAIAAGFKDVEELTLEVGLLRFYRMRAT
ncbi:MAG TPA: class I SAM-dependent methyltransferase [Candidatus Limnocylindria bacterium]|jgi:2-polyprenyl-3-methyl-5-hydroxy-6-metoxy-1,4-benzoquinol methylase